MSPNVEGSSILVVDDEEDVVQLLSYNLRKRGFCVRTASNGTEALSAAKQKVPDLIILDVVMPEMDGLDACRRIRRSDDLQHIPILMLTARSREASMIEGLDSGADSYLSKPVSIPVIISQVRAHLRSSRRPRAAPDAFDVHNLTIDGRTRTVSKSETGDAVQFAKREFSLLRFMALHPGTTFSREELLAAVWGPGADVIDRTVDVHVQKIRRHIGARYIETVQGVGYRFRP